jgi:hypothetical protein
MTLMAYLSYMLAELRLLKCISYSTLLCIFIVLVSDPPLHRQLHEMPQVCRNSPSMFFFSVPPIVHTFELLGQFAAEGGSEGSNHN